MSNIIYFITSSGKAEGELCGGRGTPAKQRKM